MAAAPHLRLLLARGEHLLPEQFSVYATLEVPLTVGTATLYVIGASSLIVVRAGGFHLAEALVCLPRDRQLRALAEAGIAADGGMTASISWRAPGLTYAARLHTAAHASDAPPLKHVLEHRFPGPLAPLTRIQAEETRPGRLEVITRHDYPEAGRIVYTASHWTLPT